MVGIITAATIYATTVRVSPAPVSNSIAIETETGHVFVFGDTIELLMSDNGTPNDVTDDYPVIYVDLEEKESEVSLCEF